MNDLIVRCPNCQTAFRVSGEQRAAADGLVRCGVCARIFDSAEQIAPAPPMSDVTASEIPPSPGIDAEEAYIRRLFAGDDSETEPPDSTVDTGHAAPLQVSPPATEPPVDPHAVAPSPAEPENDTDPVSATQDTPTVPADGEHDAEEADAAAAQPAEEPAEPQSSPEPALSGFMPPPVEIEAAPTPRKTGQLLWGLGCIAAALLLGTQYGWHEREHLLQNRTLLPWIERACRIVHCSLPRPELPHAIRSDALSIRLAPDRDGVLLVDARLANHAPYPQAWPRLAISFQDMRGRTVAGRVFDPSEYLSSAPAADMPAGPVIPIHLELRDPGEHASGYRMDILPGRTPR